MKNADIPLWDKGDDTDNFSTGGGSSFSRSEMNMSSTEKTKKLEEIYNKILGRKPTSKEIAYYKYRKLDEEALIQELLDSDEFLENIEKVQEYADLKKNSVKSKNTIIKLKAKVKDSEKEYLELKALLNEKDVLIKTLREKDTPFVVNKEGLAETKYQNYSEDANSSIVKPVTISFKKDSLFSRLLDLIFNK
jgi:hypothetical protein